MRVLTSRRPWLRLFLHQIAAECSISNWQPTRASAPGEKCRTFALAWRLTGQRALFRSDEALNHETGQVEFFVDLSERGNRSFAAVGGGTQIDEEYLILIVVEDLM